MLHSCRHLAVAALGIVALVTVASPAPAPSAVTGAASAPLLRATGNQSVNWSGYAEPGAFTSIGGSWNVPAVAATAGVTTYASTWIGIDGLANRNLIQVGTEADVIGGVPRYDAWWEILPAAERAIRKLPVQPGDHMTATVSRTAPTRWTVTLTDATSGASFTVTRHYKGPGASAEWIQERPRVGSSLATLSPYGTTLFSGLSANEAVPALVPADALSMVSAVGGPVISTPSALSRSRTAFAVAYGPTPPAAPAG